MYIVYLYYIKYKYKYNYKYKQAYQSQDGNPRFQACNNDGLINLISIPLGSLIHVCTYDQYNNITWL